VRLMRGRILAGVALRRPLKVDCPVEDTILILGRVGGNGLAAHAENMCDVDVVRPHRDIGAYKVVMREAIGYARQ